VSNFSIDYIKGITKTGLEMPVSLMSYTDSAKICLQIIASGWLCEAQYYFVKLITLARAGREPDRNASVAAAK
jgi:hypothetical protein